jgi:8-oxo-dGTP pyrophosphatase MutT (NUDIX family)
VTITGEDISDVVAAYLGRYRDEAEQLSEPLRLLATSSEFASRRSFPMHVTVGALLVRPDTEILLIKHRAYGGIILQPGGHLEPTDTTLVDAALRELAEETGIAVLDVGGHRRDKRYLSRVRPPGAMTARGRSGRVSIYLASNAARFLPATVTADEEFAAALMALREALGLEELHLTCGEPTLHPHLARVVQMGHDLGFGVCMTSNGENGARVLADCARAGFGPGQLQRLRHHRRGTGPGPARPVRRHRTGREENPGPARCCASGLGMRRAGQRQHRRAQL